MFSDFFRKLRLAVTIFVIFFIVALFAIIFGYDGTKLNFIETLEMIAIIFIMLMVLYVIVYYWYGKDYKCPACNKRFCLKKEGKEVAGRESVSVLVKANTRNRDGEVIGTQEQYIPGERVTYKITYICRKCGARCHSAYSKDVSKV
ncbi:MAG: hypothetical protein IJY09_05670 [Lachnospiraceae bacterium]|nr:hypothetical protein [Lachnospiraceae bacterium]